MIRNIVICTLHMLVGDTRLRMMNWPGHGHVSHMEKMRNPNCLGLVENGHVCGGVRCMQVAY